MLGECLESVLGFLGKSIEALRFVEKHTEENFRKQVDVGGRNDTTRQEGNKRQSLRYSSRLYKL